MAPTSEGQNMEGIVGLGFKRERGEEKRERERGASENTDGIRRMINYWWRTWARCLEFR